MFKINDPEVIITNEVLLKMQKDYKVLGGRLQAQFEKSMSKWLVLERFPEDWIRFVLFQHKSMWPLELTDLEVQLLRLSKLWMAAYSKSKYTDRKYDVNVNNIDRTYSHEVTVEGLKHWAKYFKQNILPKFIEEFFVYRLLGAKDIQLVLKLEHSENIDIRQGKILFNRATGWMCENKITSLSNTEERALLLLFQVMNKV